MGNALRSPRRRSSTEPTGVPQLFGDQAFSHDEVQQRMQAIFLHGTNPDVAFLAQNAVRPAPPEMKETQTITNDVNLIKSSLKILPDETHPSKYRLKFQFDAAKDCTVQIFFMAEETGDSASTLKYNSKTVMPKREFPAGLGLEFESEEYFDTSVYESSDLEMIDEKRCIPVVIHLGTVETSCEIQSQFTLAKLLYDETKKTYSIAVLKQTILINDDIFELHDIYGLEGAAKVTKDDETGTTNDIELDDDTDCVICLTEPRNTTVLPCRHMCLCQGCAESLRSQSNSCPICRTNVEGLLYIKV